MNGRKLTTPGAVLIFAGAFLLYYGLRQFGILPGPASATQTGSSGTTGGNTRSA
jgi:hypothetical protein